MTDFVSYSGGGEIPEINTLNYSTDIINIWNLCENYFRKSHTV